MYICRILYGPLLKCVLSERVYSHVLGSTLVKLKTFINTLFICW